MTRQAANEFDKFNREILYTFITESENHGDGISGSVLATITQFLCNFGMNIHQKSKSHNSVTPLEIIEAQIEGLRDCIIDLEAVKNRLTQGVTTQ